MLQKHTKLLVLLLFGVTIAGSFFTVCFTFFLVQFFLPCGRIASLDVKERPQPIDSLKYWKDEDTIVLGDTRGNIWFWQLCSEELPRRDEVHDSAVKAMAMLPKENLLVTASEDQTVKIWNVKSKKLEQTLQGHSRWVGCLAITPDGEKIVSGGWDNKIIIWELATGKQTFVLPSNTAIVTALVVSPDGKTLASAAGSTIILWDLENGTEIRKLQDHGFGVWLLVFTPDGKTVISGDSRTTVRFWDVATGKQIDQFDQGEERPVSSVAISSGAKLIASGDHSGIVRIWDRELGEERISVEVTSKLVVGLEFIKDDQLLVIASSDGYAKILDVQTGKIVKELQIRL